MSADGTKHDAAELHASEDIRSWLQAKKAQQRFRIGVSFRNLDCIGRRSSDTDMQTVVSPLWRLFRQNISKDHVTILSDFEGLIEPHEMLLVLGRPGSGCSTFLKSLSGELHGFRLGKKATVNYQGRAYEDFHKNYSGERRYLAELDAHFADLALGETLEFAAATSTASTDRDQKAQEPSTNEIAQSMAAQFRLKDAYRTMVGDVVIRGLSGGEKRRTSIAEAFVGASQFQCWDNSTRGLDSLTAKRFIQLLRESTTQLDLTVAMSLYQASESMYQLFDKVMLLYEGREIFFGPVSAAADYFYNLGYARPSDATTPDFLTSLTSPQERVVRQDWKGKVLNTPDEFAEAWKNSSLAKQLQESIAEFEAKYLTFNKHPTPSSDPSTTSTDSILRFSTFPTTLTKQVTACLVRAQQRFKNNPAPTISNIVANAVLGVIIGSAFYNLNFTSDSLQPRSILLFFISMLNSFLPAFEVDLMWAHRPIVEKQQRYALYHAFTHHIACVLADFPAKLLLSVILHLPVYFMANLHRTGAAFFTYWLFMLVNIVTMSMLFRMIGALSRSRNGTMVPLPIITLLCVIYTGFVVPPPYMKPWLAWFRFINPIAYTYEAVMINELHGRLFACSHSIPEGPSYMNLSSDDKLCAQVGRLPGTNQVSGSEYLRLKYHYVESHLWRNLGILLAMMVVFGIVLLIGTEYIASQKSRGEVLQFKNRSKRLIDEEKPVSVSEKRVQKLPHSTSHRPQITSSGQPGAVVGVQPASPNASVFHWQDICYGVKVKKESRAILKDISGWVQPGSLTALMGPTGAGKTTLLDALAGRSMPGQTSGDVKINNRLRDAGIDSRRRIGYVQQNDIHLPTTTVREALQFSALLRQSKTYSRKERLAYVEDVLDILEMTSYADAVVGVPGEGLNVEQRKRLSIGVEMVARPDVVLFLDEPTSGLDSQTAWSICMLLRKLVDHGHAVLCTVHQPSAQLFNVFDRVLLLKQGETIYFGDIGAQAATLKGYFQSRGSRKCQGEENPAEWMMDVTEHLPAALHEGRSWADLWRTSPENNTAVEQLSAITAEISEYTSDEQNITDESRYGASVFTQLSVLLLRVSRDHWRSPIYLYTKFAACFGLSFVNGFSFYNANHDIQGLTNALFSAFLICQMFSVLTMLIIPRFISGRDLFEARERDSRMYSWVIFLVANLVVECASLLLVALVIFLPWYYPTGLFRNSDVGFGMSERAAMTFLLILLFVVWVGTISQAFAAMIDLSETAIQMVTLCIWLSLVFCGILVTPLHLPRFWIFMYRVSPLTYFLEGLAIAGFSGTDVTCSSVETLYVPPPSHMGSCEKYLAPYMKTAGGYVSSSVDGKTCGFCPVSDANVVLKSLGMHSSKMIGWRNVGILVGYVAFDIALVFVLYYLVRLPRQKATQKR